MAVPTVGDIVAKVREYMLDTEPAAYRYSDALVVGAVFDGLRVLHSARPESQYEGLKLVSHDYPFVTPGTPAEEVEAAKEMPWHLEPRWEMAVRYFACARCFEVDSSDTINLQRAQECQANFTNLIKM